MRGSLGLVALALAHVARSEVIVSDFTALQNAIADGADIRIKPDPDHWTAFGVFDWTAELVIRSGVTVTITGEWPILDRRGGGRFFNVKEGGTLVVSGVTFQNGRSPVSRCMI